MKYEKAFRDQFGNFILQTETRDGLDYGVFVNVKSGRVNDPEPVGSIGRFTHYSEWEEFDGELPDDVQKLLGGAK